jgi:hypothetical protein
MRGSLLPCDTERESCMLLAFPQVLEESAAPVDFRRVQRESQVLAA